MAGNLEIRIYMPSNLCCLFSVHTTPGCPLAGVPTSFVQLDQSDLASVKAGLVTDFKHDRLNMLIFDAGSIMNKVIRK